MEWSFGIGLYLLDLILATAQLPMIFAGTPRVLRGWSNVSLDVFFSFKPRNNHSATSNSRLLQTPEPCANEIWKLKEHSLPLWSPQRR